MKNRKKKNRHKENVNRLNILANRYEKDLEKIEQSGIMQLVEKSKVLVKELDNDIKIRLSNSYIIDGKKFILKELELNNEHYIVIDNETVSLVYRMNADKALLYRNGNLIRIYIIPKYLKEDKEDYIQFFTLLLEIIENNPQLTL